MSFDLLRTALVTTLVALAACDDGGDGRGSGAGGGGGGDPGGGSVPSSGTYPFLPGRGSEPLRTPTAICEGACDCDPACVEQRDVFVADCVQRFADDRAIAASNGCDDAYDRYYACYSGDWTCEAPGACDDETDALSSCLATLCETANELCGCPGCATGCRSAEERCWATCVVEAGSCSGDDRYYECTSACYDDVGGSSSAGGGWE